MNKSEKHRVWRAKSSLCAETSSFRSFWQNTCLVFLRKFLWTNLSCRVTHLERVLNRGGRPGSLVIAAPCNRGHYIFALWFLSIFFYLSFFPRLISAATDWMSTILLHMVWSQCEFRMQVWNVLHAARCKCRTQKSRQKSPSGYHPTTLSGYIFANKACIDHRKKTC